MDKKVKKRKYSNISDSKNKEESFKKADMKIKKCIISRKIIINRIKQIMKR